jgi:HK97 gp10 family phage protein
MTWMYSSTIQMDKLYELSNKLGTVSMMLDDIGDQTVEEIKQNAPVDTGKLRDSIKHDPIPDGILIHDGVTYGIYNEFGTYKMAARPFFIPATNKIGTLITEKFTELMR